MSLRRPLALFAASTTLALGGCMTPAFHADVARFQVMPPPQGQTFFVEAADPQKRGGIEFSTYAGLVAQELQKRGYQPAANPGAASFVVDLDYGVDNGQQKVETTPGVGFGGWGPGWGGPGWGGGWSGGWGWGGGFGWGGGWAGWGGWGWDYPDVHSYTVYTSSATMVIDRTGDGQRLFEGHATARSTGDSLPRLVPHLIQALFTGFPGNSGEEVRITIPNDPAKPVTVEPKRESMSHY